MIQPSSVGTPRAATVSSLRRKSTLVSVLPTPSARAASWALHTAGKIEPPLRSYCENANRNSGTASKWSARCWAERTMLSSWRLAGASGSARAAAI